MQSVPETQNNEPPGLIHPDQPLSTAIPTPSPSPEAQTTTPTTEPVVAPPTEAMSQPTAQPVPTAEFPKYNGKGHLDSNENLSSETLTTNSSPEAQTTTPTPEPVVAPPTEAMSQPTAQPDTQDLNPQNPIDEQVQANLDIPDAPLTGSGGQPLGAASEAETISSEQKANIITTAPPEETTNNSATSNIELQTATAPETPQKTEPNLDALKAPLTEQIEADEKSPSPLTQTFMKFDEMLKGASGNDGLERIILEAAKDVAEKIATSNGIPASSVQIDSTQNQS